MVQNLKYINVITQTCAGQTSTKNTVELKWQPQTGTTFNIQVLPIIARSGSSPVVVFSWGLLNCGEWGVHSSLSQATCPKSPERERYFTRQMSHFFPGICKLHIEQLTALGNYHNQNFILYDLVHGFHLEALFRQALQFALLEWSH